MCIAHIVYTIYPCVAGEFRGVMFFRRCNTYYTAYLYILPIHVRKVMINYSLGGGRASLIAIIMSFLPVGRGTPSIDPSSG